MTDEHGLSANLDDLHKAKATQGRVRPLESFMEGLQAARLLCPWDFPSKNTGVGFHFLLQGIFPTQRWNLHLLHWQIAITGARVYADLKPEDRKLTRSESFIQGSESNNQLQAQDTEVLSHCFTRQASPSLD
ncbi:hypothetical protein CapIbe_007564 [Capra ibex]